MGLHGTGILCQGDQYWHNQKSDLHKLKPNYKCALKSADWNEGHEVSIEEKY